MQALTANILAPPDGDVKDIPSLQQTIRDWVAENEETVKATGIIMGFGWDKSTLAERRDPTLAELDAISTEYPVLLIHQSSHLGALNSLALAKVGITRDTPNPPGGVILKDADGNPTGILEENAFIGSAMKLLADLDVESMKTIAQAGSELWAEYGYTTAIEGRSTPPQVDALRIAGEEGRFKIDVLTYPDILITGIDYIKERLQPDLQEPLSRGRRQADHRRVAPGLHRAARPALLRPRGQLPAGLPWLCRRLDRAGDKGHR